MISRLFVCILMSFLLPRYIIVFSIEFTLSEIYLNLKLALRKFSGPHSNTYDYSIYCYFYILQLTSFNGIWKIKKHDWHVLLHFFEISRSWLKSVFYKRTVCHTVWSAVTVVWHSILTYLWPFKFKAHKLQAMSSHDLNKPFWTICKLQSTGIGIKDKVTDSFINW